MKGLLVSITITIIIAATAAALLLTGTVNLDTIIYYYPCSQPMPYHLGNIDPRFQLTDQEVISDISKATAIWATAYGRPLFVDEPTAKLTINFVYDSRQALTTQINSQTSTVNQDKTSLDQRIATFKSNLADYNSQVTTLNSQIDSWNQKGGAPPDVYNQLTQQQNDLRSQQQKLQTEANALNQLTNSYNFQVSQLNNTINTFNTVLAQTPEEGLYDGQTDTISIFFDPSKNELIHTLAHEFGHALGLGHVQSPDAIMYPYTSESITPNAVDLVDLTTACQRVNKLALIGENIQTRFTTIPH